MKRKAEKLVAVLSILAALTLALVTLDGERPSIARSEPEAAARDAAPRGSDGASTLRRRLEPLLDKVSVSLEPSCPPPALLACRTAVRLSGALTGPPSPRLQRRVGAAVRSALRQDGFRRLEVRVEGGGGKIVSGAETLAQWRTARTEIEVVTTGLALDR